MGRHIIAKTGNVAAVQRQLGHKNAARMIVSCGQPFCRDGCAGSF
jgi:hypothetical protein